MRVRDRLSGRRTATFLTMFKRDRRGDSRVSLDFARKLHAGTLARRPLDWPYESDKVVGRPISIPVAVKPVAVKEVLP